MVVGGGGGVGAGGDGSGSCSGVGGGSSVGFSHGWQLWTKKIDRKRTVRNDAKRL